MSPAGAPARLDLFAQQERNRTLSRRVVVAFIAFFAWLGFGGDYIAYLYTRNAPAGEAHYRFPLFGIMLLLIAGAIATYAWKTGARQVLWSTKAREITTPVTDVERQFVNVVDEMSIASGLPRPRVWIVPDDDPNAFATGTDASHANIAATEGLLRALGRDELQAVIAHEMGHIANLDVRLMTILAALVGTIALITDGVGRTLNIGGRNRSNYSSGGSSSSGSSGSSGSSSSSSSDRDGGGVGALVVVLLVVWAISWLLAPFITRLLAMSVSRRREFLADAMSAQYTRNPIALAAALAKIESAAKPTLA
ncbi:MAG: M48 family metalloprotease, partial [Gemmatimonadaceae bacterium]